MIKVAVAQMDPKLGKVAANLARIEEMVQEALTQGAQLVVFPECAVSGYGFANLEGARPFAETIPGPVTMALASICAGQRRAEGGPYVVVGMLELGDAGAIYNSAVLVGPEGVVGVYRKAHLPWLGVDRFTTPAVWGY